MDYKQFQDEIKKYMQYTFPANYEINVEDISKNNGEIKAALMIKEVDNPMSPCIYLEDAFESYKKGEDISSIAEKIKNIYYEAMESVPDFPKLDNILENHNNIFPVLVNKELNKELLKHIPNRDYAEDLSIIYKMQIKEEEFGVSITTIYNNFMTSLGLNEESLHKIAIENLNTNPAFRPVFKDMMNTFCVLSNEKYCFGANVVLNKEFMRAAAEKVNGEFLLIPSSINEFLAVVPEEGKDVEELIKNTKGILKEVNSTIDPKEILSYNLYRYNGQELEIVKDVNQEWKVSKNIMMGDKPYIVYRLKDANEVDCSDNREYCGDYMSDLKEAEALAEKLNNEGIKEADVEQHHKKKERDFGEEI